MPEGANCDQYDPINVYLNTTRTIEDDLENAELILDQAKINLALEPFLAQIVKMIRFLKKMVSKEDGLPKKIY